MFKVAKYYNVTHLRVTLTNATSSTIIGCFLFRRERRIKIQMLTRCSDFLSFHLYLL